jgi:hypothetical protein
MIVYTKNGKTVTRDEWMKDARGIEAGHPPAVYGDQCDWHTENGGKGRWSTQLRTHVKDRQDLIDKGRKRGLRPINFG